MHAKTLRSDLWQARAALLAVIALQLAVRAAFKLTDRSVWVLSALEFVLLVVLVVTSERRARRFVAALEEPGHAAEAASSGKVSGPRTLTMGLIGVVSMTNLIGLVRLVYSLLGASKAQGVVLLGDAVVLFATNVIIFGLWYWELDRGGPWQRVHRACGPADFLFPQMSIDPARSPESIPAHWRPRFIDYLYLAFTNATAFSPTDTLPLSGTAKLLMAVQAGGSLLTLAVVAARAVNILA